MRSLKKLKSWSKVSTQPVFRITHHLINTGVFLSQAVRYSLPLWPLETAHTRLGAVSKHYQAEVRTFH